MGCIACPTTRSTVPNITVEIGFATIRWIRVAVNVTLTAAPQAADAFPTLTRLRTLLTARAAIHGIFEEIGLAAVACVTVAISIARSTRHN